MTDNSNVFTSEEIGRAVCSLLKKGKAKSFAHLTPSEVYAEATMLRLDDALIEAAPSLADEKSR